MSHTVVVYHSGYGHTRKQAEAVQQGAAGVPGASAELVEINAEGPVARRRLGKAGKGRRHRLRLADLHGRPVLAIQALCRCQFQGLVFLQVAQQDRCRLHQLRLDQR
jgi:hypothetical protein